MAKEAYYFSHDTNARRDPKILALRSEYGNEGYAWYWILVEMLSEQEGYKMEHKKWNYYGIAMEMLCDAEKVEKFINSLVNDYELLASDGDFFWSESLLRRMGIKEEKRKKKVEAGRKGAQKRWNEPEKKGNGTEEGKNEPAPKFAEAIEFYKDNLKPENKPVAKSVVESIGYWCNEIGEELAIEAMKRAAMGGSTFRNADGILKDWSRRGINTMELVQQDDKDFAGRKREKDVPVTEDKPTDKKTPSVPIDIPDFLK